MGAAWALQKDVIPLLLPPLVPSDLSDVFGDRQFAYLIESAALDEVRDRLSVPAAARPASALWTAQRQLFIERAKTHQASSNGESIMERGQTFDYMIDAALYVPYGIPDIQRAIVDDLRAARMLSTLYSYIAESGFRHWIDLTNDPQYSFYRESLRFFTTSAEDVAREITRSIGTKAVDFISLGPGDGRKDRELLTALLLRTRVADLYYYPVDVNSNMIAAAARAILTDEILRANLRIKGIATDFTRLAMFKPIYQFRAVPNVISLLGNTLGNMDNERRFLDQLFESAMLEGDILLLEVKTRPAPGRQQILSSDASRDALGNIELNKRFDFGPLEIIGVAFDDSMLSYRAAFGLSSIPNTETTVACYESVQCKGEQFRNAKLSCIHSYDPQMMETVLKDVGFAILRCYEKEGFALWVAQKPLG
jgi:hypothetical protein